VVAISVYLLYSTSVEVDRKVDGVAERLALRQPYLLRAVHYRYGCAMPLCIAYYHFNGKLERGHGYGHDFSIVKVRHCKLYPIISQTSIKQKGELGLASLASCCGVCGRH